MSPATMSKLEALKDERLRNGEQQLRLQNELHHLKQRQRQIAVEIAKLK
jgi:hypothetical protein